jgi:hypothetical protein
MVPVERIELPTFGLQNRCSTAELNRHLFDFTFLSSEDRSQIRFSLPNRCQ